jgi:hypothetical protein
MAVGTGALSRVVVLLAVTFVVFFLLLASRVYAGGELRSTTVHVVQPGETLWEIAGELTGPEGDVRRIIYDIKRMNGLETSGIGAGDRLVVPAPSGEDG